MTSELIPDSELSELLAQNVQILGDQGLDRLVRTHQRFDKPVTVRYEDDTATLEEHYFLKQVLREVPPYFDAARKASLSARQSESLLIYLLNATPYDFERNEINILLLRRALDQEASQEQGFSKEDVSTLRKMIRLGGKYGVLPSSLHGFTAARRLGISVDDSANMVMHLSDADGSFAGYTFGSFNEAIASLSVAQVEPELVVRTFGLLGGERPYYRLGAYRVFEKAITFACPSERITPQELMQTYFIHGQGEDIAEFYARVFSKKQSLSTIGIPQKDILSPTEERDQHFVPKNGRLEYAALPYRTELPLEDGLRDLEQLAKASSQRWESVGEGYWVFDPNSRIWYSLGGKSDREEGRVRHNFIKYDLSDLSSEPIMFHTHPEQLEIWLRDPYNDFPTRRYRDHVTKFLSSTPSRADYGVVAASIEDAVRPIKSRSFIVHSLGITEFTYPNDLDAIRKMAVESRDIRDKVMLDFSWDYLQRFSWTMGKYELVNILVDMLDASLPEGFSIKLYPVGIDADTILQAQAR